MTCVYWLEQTEADVPAENDWLSLSEAARLNDMHIAKRRADWRLGRWTAKRALATYPKLSGHPPALADIEVRAEPSGAPEVFLANQPAAITISLSHRAGVAICAVAPPGVALGCDLEVIEPRSNAFLADYFTAEEQALVAQAAADDRPRLLALLWSGKESALKALRAGLRADTRCVVVCPVEKRPANDRQGHADHPILSAGSAHQRNIWCPLNVRHTSGAIFHGWWQNTDTFLRTLVAAPPPAAPILLAD
ncbi:MAG TPA: 4'-phosphopantetheinyl transferase superfamily protein [Terriglobales bacterium]|jgi:4'-phosphopantetheinyl transferase|nr:4'-phosphopantetheinyl transferase superfamily protein [Terriglobales bacterium]